MSFRIYPFTHPSRPNRSCWYVVDVVTQKELQAMHGKKCKTCKASFNCKDALGLTHCHSGEYTRDQFGQVVRPKVKGEIGVITLSLSNLEPEIISHECTHATMYLLGFFTQVLVMHGPSFADADEWFAQIQGAFVRQIMDTLPKIR